MELPDREGLRARVAQHADVELAPVDVLLGDGVRADLLPDEAHALGELVVVVDDRGARDPERGLLAERLDEQGEVEVRRALDPASLAEHREAR
ncbi:MAG: hypothetical protein ABFS34_16895, partial [Gemmatimonadota bacterium]